MTQLVINDVEQPIDAEHKTWRDLLAVLERQAAESGQAVTAIRFDGVEKPTYRDGEELSRDLEAFGRIEVFTAPTSALFRQGLSEAAGAIETLCGAASRIGMDFRGHDLGGANKELVSLAQSLGTLVTLIGVVGRALDVNFESFDVSGSTASHLFEETGTQIGSLVRSQQDEDWIAVADTLEYDVSPTLGRWRELLSALHERAGAEAVG